MAIMEDGSASRGKTVAAGVAVVLFPLMIAGDAFAFATWTSDTVRPAQLRQSSAALFIIPKLLDQLDEVHFCLNSRFYFARFANSN